MTYLAFSAVVCVYAAASTAGSQTVRECTNVLPETVQRSKTLGSGHVADTKLKRAKRVQVGCAETPKRLRVSAHSVIACSELTNTRWSAARRFARSPRRRSRCTRRHGFAERCCCVCGGDNPLKAEHTRSPAGARLGLVCIAAHCPRASAPGLLPRTAEILLIIYGSTTLMNKLLTSGDGGRAVCIA